MSSTICNLNQDCDPYGTNRLCYFNSSEIGVCSCNAYYGWTGANCEEQSFATTFQILWCTLIAILAFSSCGVNLLLLRSAWNLVEIETVIGKLQNNRVLTLILFVLFTLSVGNWGLGRTLNANTLSGSPLLFIEGEELDLEYGYGGRFETYQDAIGIAPSIIFGILGISNVALVWAKIAKATASLNRLSRSFGNYTLRIRVFQGFALLLLLCANFVDRFAIGIGSIVGFPILFLNLIIASGYIYGASLLLPMLQQLKNNHGPNNEIWKNKFYPLVKNIKITTAVMVPSLLLLGSSWAAYSTMDSVFTGNDRVKYFGDGREPEIVSAAWADQFAITGALMAALTGTRFLFKSRSISREESEGEFQRVPTIQFASESATKETSTLQYTSI